MRIGFAPDAENENEDAEIVDLGTGMAVVNEGPETSEGYDNVAYLAFQVGPLTMEWRLHR